MRTDGGREWEESGKIVDYLLLFFPSALSFYSIPVACINVYPENTLELGSKRMRRRPSGSFWQLVR